MEGDEGERRAVNNGYVYMYMPIYMYVHIHVYRYLSGGYGDTCLALYCLIRPTTIELPW